MNVATVSAALKPTVPLTVLLAASFTVNDTVPGVTGWENVADGATDTALPVDPPAGVTVVTAGGVAPADVRVHHVDPVIRRVIGAGRERVRRAVRVHPAAGQRGQRPVRHRRRQPVLVSPRNAPHW